MKDAFDAAWDRYVRAKETRDCYGVVIARLLLEGGAIAEYTKQVFRRADHDTAMHRAVSSLLAR